MKVSDIMTSEGLATATLDATLAEIAIRMRDENVGAIPIVDEEEKLAGIITDRDLVVRGIAQGEDPSRCTAADILSEQIHSIHPGADLEEAADLMARHQIRRLPVVEDEVIVGMISLGDIAVKSEEDEAAGALENISDGVRETGARQGPGSLRAPSDQGRGRAEEREEIESRRNPRVSAGEQAPSEEADYQRQNAGRQSGGSRSGSSLASRLRNWSRSQQTVVHEVEQNEGEDPADFENPTAADRVAVSTPQPAASGARNRIPSQIKEPRRAQAEGKKDTKVTAMRGSGRPAARNKSKRKAS